MVAELVETTRLWGRVAARIDPADVEPLAGHLVKRTYSEPRWDARRGSVVATERVTLYGLPIVTDRTVAVRADRPGALARAVHPHARWWRASGRPGTRSSRRTARLVEEVEELEHRSRRRDILVDDQALFDVLRRAGAGRCRSRPRGFDRWWRDGAAHPDLLTFTRERAGRARPMRSTSEAWPRRGGRAS